MNNGQDWTKEIYAQAEESIGYCFSDKQLLLTAFTHTSYANVFGGEHNERLEYLGDAVLELCVTERLYKNRGMDEGEMTAARQNRVSECALDQSMQAMGALRFLRHSGGESNLGGKTASNLFEAITGAVYLDGGLNAARSFLDRHLVEADIRNYKSMLQEFVQEQCKTTPAYRQEAERDGIFYFSVSAMGRSAKGSGTSKKAAQTQAARALLAILKEEVHQ